MKLILSPKDNLNKIVLQNVKTFCLEGQTLCVVFEDGYARNYPLEHLWYYQSEQFNPEDDDAIESSLGVVFGARDA